MLKKTARLVQRGIPNHIEHFCFFFAKFKFSKHLREKNFFFAGGQNLPPVVNLLQEAQESIYHNPLDKESDACTFVKVPEQEKNTTIHPCSETQELQNGFYDRKGKVGYMFRISEKDIKDWSFNFENGDLHFVIKFDWTEKNLNVSMHRMKKDTKFTYSVK